MNIALLIAGGLGNRMKQDIPKQFLNIYDKPVIIYTLEIFEKHKEIDAIYVSCLEGWENVLMAYAKQFNITKLKGIITSSKTPQESIRNALETIKKDGYDDDDFVLVHDAIRPMLSETIITDNIKTCKKYGNAITVIPCAEVMVQTEDQLTSEKIILRDSLKRTQTPQTFPLGKFLSIHRKAVEKGIKNTTASVTLFIEMKEKVYFTPGSEKNVKLTTIDDIDIFKALLSIKESDWLKNDK